MEYRNGNFLMFLANSVILIYFIDCFLFSSWALFFPHQTPSPSLPPQEDPRLPLLVVAWKFPKQKPGRLWCSLAMSSPWATALCCLGLLPQHHCLYILFGFPVVPRWVVDTQSLPRHLWGSLLSLFVQVLSNHRMSHVP